MFYRGMEKLGRRKTSLEDSVISAPSSTRRHNENWLGKKYPVVRRRFNFNPVCMGEKILIFNRIWAGGVSRRQALKKLNLSWTSYLRWSGKLDLRYSPRGPRKFISSERRLALLECFRIEVKKEGDLKRFLKRHRLNEGTFFYWLVQAQGHGRTLRPKQRSRAEYRALFTKIRRLHKDGTTLTEVYRGLGLKLATVTSARVRLKVRPISRLAYVGVPDAEARRVATEILKQFSRGKPLGSVCKSFGWSKPRFHHYRMRFGFKSLLRDISREELQGRLERVEKLRAQGYNRDQAAREVGLADGSLQHLKKELRKRGKNGEQRQMFRVREVFT